MKKQISRISILQSSKIATVLYAMMGCIYTLIGISMVLFAAGQQKIIGVVFCFAPIFMGALGFVFFVIFAALYNLLAKWLGGFEFEIVTRE